MTKEAEGAGQPDISAKDAVLPGLIFIVMFLLIVGFAVMSAMSKFYELESCRVGSVGELVSGGRGGTGDHRTIEFTECPEPVGNEVVNLKAPSALVHDPPLEGKTYDIRVQIWPNGSIQLIGAKLAAG